jgi:hypothetical protein
MNSAPVTIEEVVVAILELAKRKLNKEQLADLVSAGRLHEVLPYRPRLQVPAVLERWEDVTEAPARELTEEEYSHFLRGGDAPVLVERILPAPHTASEPSGGTQDEAEMTSTHPRAEEPVLHSESSGEIVRSAIEKAQLYARLMPDLIAFAETRHHVPSLGEPTASKLRLPLTDYFTEFCGLPRERVTLWESVELVLLRRRDRMLCQLYGEIPEGFHLQLVANDQVLELRSKDRVAVHIPAAADLRVGVYPVNDRH